MIEFFIQSSKASGNKMSLKQFDRAVMVSFAGLSAGGGIKKRVEARAQGQTE